MTTQTATYPGQLDEGFANKGIARITIPGYSWLRIESVKSIGAGADQKIYFTGWCYNEDAPAPEDYFVLGRLNVDGSPDALFGTDGVVMGQFAGLDSQAKSLAIQDGNILLFGGANLGRPQKAPAFARFTSEGTLDKNFGDQGYTVLDIDLAPPAPASGQKAPQ